MYVCDRRGLLFAELSTKHDFQLQRGKGLPTQLIPFIRLCYCQEESTLQDINLLETGALTEADQPILAQLVQYIQNRLARYAMFTPSKIPVPPFGMSE